MLELEGAVRRYQAVVVDLKEFPATTCPMHLLDFSCNLPADMPTTVTSALIGPHGQHLVIKTRLRADRSHGHLFNPVEQVARSILYRAVLYIRRASLGLFLLFPMMLSACFAYNVLPVMQPNPTPSRISAGPGLCLVYRRWWPRPVTSCITSSRAA